jgi:hypothetical protein
MRYMLLIYKDEAWWDALTAAEQRGLVQKAIDYAEPRRAGGFYLGGERLQGTDTTTMVRIKDGRPLITDGPFAETKEQLAGYMILDAPNLDEVLDFTRHHPLAQAGLAIEIRPLRGGPGEMDTGAKPAPRF